MEGAILFSVYTVTGFRAVKWLTYSLYPNLLSLSPTHLPFCIWGNAWFVQDSSTSKNSWDLNSLQVLHVRAID